MDGKRMNAIPTNFFRTATRGAFAGVIGAILMGVSASTYSSVIGGGWSTPMQAVAGTYYKAMTFVGGAGVTAIGSFTHITIGAIFGVLFAFLTWRMRSTIGLFVLGIVYGTAIWAFMTGVTIPVLDWVMYPRVMLMGAFWYFLHWIYGGFMGLTLVVLRGPDRNIPKEPLAGAELA